MISILGLFDLFGRGRSLEDYIRRLQELWEEEFDILLSIAGYYLDEGEHENAMEYLEKAFKVAVEMDDKELEAVVLDFMGDVYLDKREMDIAIEYFKEAFKIYSSIKSPRKAEMKEKISEVEKMKEAIEMAELHKKFEETPKIFEPGKLEVDIDKIIPKLRTLLGRLESEYKPSEGTIEELKEALDIATAINDESGEASILLTLGTRSFEDKNYDDAFNYFERAAEIFAKKGNKMPLGVVNVFLGVIHFIKGNEEEALENFRNAIKLFGSSDDSKASRLVADICRLLYRVKG
ncbi:lipopolysaccharide assembly protein LapB [Methanothermobacter tenebrarum]|nr:tetratricopeptide repeat protein [Methanothermobacter tenebrarum]NPV64771.1 tetratricopeptide repeat protein [Methanobacteriaceae archaeon]